MSLSIITSCTNLPLTEISTGGERRLNFRQRSESVKILRLSGAVCVAIVGHCQFTIR